MNVEQVDIIGTGESSLGYDWSTNNIKWSVGSAFNSYKDNINLYFCIHDGEIVDHACITQEDYPLHDIIDEFGSEYFTCSISYMIAYAMYIGVSEINIYGVDMSIGSEYSFERPSVLYWIGRAEGMGIKVNSNLNEGLFLYGYEMDKIISMENSVNTKITYARKQIESTTGDIKNQWLGRLHTLKELKNIIRA
jgi:hypothetical protein